VNLSQQNLRKYNLSVVRFCKANLTGADLLETDIAGSLLRNANLAGDFLPGANFNHAELQGANLTKADLRRTVLQDANLSRSILCGATGHLGRFRGANFFEADLSGASFNTADFSGGNLSWANLGKATLEDVNLSGVNLSEANLEQASLERTIFGDTNLKNAQLSNCRFAGPCTLDHRTLQQSGPLPLAFLRGCGLSDKLIEFVPSLFNDQAIHFYSCFISYSSKDEDFAKRLHVDLQDAGVRCWFAPEDMKTGDRILQRIDESIKVYDKLMIILSKQSLFSDWVEDEVETALEKERKKRSTVLFPIRVDQAIEETDIAWAAKIRRTCHIGDFSQWKDHDAYQVAFKRLLKDLKEDTLTLELERG